MFIIVCNERFVPNTYFSFKMSSNRGGFSAGTTSCKCHEMSSIKNVCGEGWVERGFYLPEEGEVRVRAREPLVPE